MLPAEYSSVEFKTRMASYSDDDQEGGAQEADDVKQKRRESNADAWVDILVDSQTRRIGVQDAEFPDKKRGNRNMDPELASLEVAQVLAAVRNRSPSPTSVMEPVDNNYAIDRHLDDLDIDEVDVAPRGSDTRSVGSTESASGGLAYDESSVGHDVDISAVLTASQVARHRQPSYFDLHPDRRPAVSQPVADDPRAKFAANDSDDDEPVPARPAGDIRPLPVPPAAPAPPPKAQPALHEPTPLVPAKLAVAAMTQSLEVRNASSAVPASNTLAIPVTPSKTAALIEMYRERERGTSPKPASAAVPVPIVIAPLAPSRLPIPIRTASLPEKSGALPLPPVPIPSKTSPPEPALIDLPRINIEETGRSSPARYVHGAPLQNVIEEEEE